MNKDRKLYRKAEQYVIEQFQRVKLGHQITHFQRTVYWLLQLIPDADEAMQIAALTHDIERAFRDPRLDEMVASSAEGFKDIAFLQEHSEKGARIIANFLKVQGANPRMIERVKILVEGHEFSGSDDQNAIKDADSLSYFENNIKKFLSHDSKIFGKSKVKAKFDWMYNRITSPKARQLAAPLYHEALVQLEKV